MATKYTGHDGGQIVPPQDAGIINEVNSLDFSEINFDANEALIDHRWIRSR